MERWKMETYEIKTFYKNSNFLGVTVLLRSWKLRNMWQEYPFCAYFYLNILETFLEIPWNTYFFYFFRTTIKLVEIVREYPQRTTMFSHWPWLSLQNMGKVVILMFSGGERWPRLYTQETGGPIQKLNLMLIGLVAIWNETKKWSQKSILSHFCWPNIYILLLSINFG